MKEDKQSEKIDISIIIPTFNNCEVIRDALESLHRQQGVSGCAYEILVVDNNSTDRTREVVNSYIQKFDGCLKYVFEKEQGTAYARNKGLQTAQGAVLAFMDDDCVVQPNWIKEIFNTFQDPDVEVVLGKVVLTTPIPDSIWYPEWMIKQRFAHVDYGKDIRPLGEEDIVTANIALRREVFDRCGAFSTYDAFKTNEDSEFSARIKKMEVKRIYNPGMVVHHNFSLDRLDEQRILKQTFYWGRSNILIEKTNLSALRHFLYCLRQILKRAGKLAIANLRKNREEAFALKCKIYGSWGRCVQLWKNRFESEAKSYG